jgi:hypothetical protein
MGSDDESMRDIVIVDVDSHEVFAVRGTLIVTKWRASWGNATEGALGELRFEFKPGDADKLRGILGGGMSGKGLEDNN